jgi:hypothetical protein
LPPLAQRGEAALASTFRRNFAVARSMGEREERPNMRPISSSSTRVLAVAAALSCGVAHAQVAPAPAPAPSGPAAPSLPAPAPPVPPANPPATAPTVVDPPPSAQEEPASPAPPSEPPEPAAPEPPEPAAPELPPPRFGEAGQWVIVGASNSTGVSSETFSASQATFFNAGASIGVDRFIAPNFSLGIDLEASYGDNKGYNATSLTETTSTHLAGGVRFGFNVPIGRLWSWYPRMTLGVNSNRSDTQTVTVFAPDAAAAPASSTSQVGPWINLYAPLLVHPVPHFFLGFGPRLQRTFAELKGGP